MQHERKNSHKVEMYLYLQAATGICWMYLPPVCVSCHIIGSTLIAPGDCHQHIGDEYDMLVKVTNDYCLAIFSQSFSLTVCLFGICIDCFAQNFHKMHACLHKQRQCLLASC